MSLVSIPGLHRDRTSYNLRWVRFFAQQRLLSFTLAIHRDARRYPLEEA